MKTATKVILGILGGAAVLAASQESAREYVGSCVCCMLRALGLV